ncbi:hypothetical protein [Actinocrispum sp. NPDC049592]|uniref:hypothetical protein n=1 Tax=Actinocrispum sp. NPDC049592 TaxID=3154835 RepID=UPI003434FC7C
MVVSDAIVPMLLWPSVPVIHLVYEELTVVDRFVVEAALAIAPVRVEDIEEITGIPRDAITRIAGRLSGLDLLRVDGLDYYANEFNARQALDRRSVAERRPTSLTFLYLPYTDDMVAFAPGHRPDPPHLHKVRKTDPAPLPTFIGGQSRAQLIRDRISAGDVAGLPAGMELVDVADDAGDDIVSDWCPAYRCRGHVRTREDATTLILDVFDSDGRRAAKCMIPAATGQAEEWRELLDHAGSAGEAWQSGGGLVTASRTGPMAWSYELDCAAAQSASDSGIALSEPASLLIQDSTNEVVVNTDFVPADNAASKVFALDQAIRAVSETDLAKVQPDSVARAVEAANSSYGLADDVLTEAEVMQRLWANHHYRHIYAMRTIRDFDYD